MSSNKTASKRTRETDWEALDDALENALPSESRSPESHQERQSTHGDEAEEAGQAKQEKGRPKAAEPHGFRTGSHRIDLLLEGGLPQGTATLLLGPPFIGKDFLARSFVAEGARQAIPSVFLLTDRSALETQRAMRHMDDDAIDWEAEGLLMSVDAYSRTIGDAAAVPHTQYADGPLDLNGITMALNECQRRLQAKHDNHLLVIDSLSTLVAHSSAQATFRFLQVLLGRAKRGGATVLANMDVGMHDPLEIHMFRHLVDGTIEMREHNAKTQMQVQGLGLEQNIGWIDYVFQLDSIDITGSFAGGRIR